MDLLTANFDWGSFVGPLCQHGPDDRGVMMAQVT